MPGGRSLRFSLQVTCVAVVLALFLPAMAHANSTTCLNGAPAALCINNSGGTATGGASGLIMNGSAGSAASTVNSIGPFGSPTDNIGSLSLTTGAILSGSFVTSKGLPSSTPVTFANGTFTITNTGDPQFGATLFQGTFGNSAGGAPITWTYTGKVGQYYDYTLSGPVSGTFNGGATVSGVTTQLYFHTKTPYDGGSISLSSGTTTFITPEPETLTLLGSGLMSMGFVVWRKVRSAIGV